MKQQVEIQLEAHEQDALREGRRVMLEIGGHAIGLRFTALAEPSPNGHRPKKSGRRKVHMKNGVVVGRCYGCGRHLDQGQKHVKGCKVLNRENARRMVATKQRLRREKEAKA